MITVKQQLGPWSVVMTWSGEPVAGPDSVTLEPADDVTATDLAGGLSSTVLRKVDFGSARREARDQWERGTDRRPDHGPRLRLLLSQRNVGDGFLATLAQAYVEQVGLGDRAPTAYLAEITGRSPATVRDYLKQARRRNLLTSVSHQAGGELTDQGRAALDSLISERV